MMAVAMIMMYEGQRATGDAKLLRFPLRWRNKILRAESSGDKNQGCGQRSARSVFAGQSARARDRVETGPRVPEA